MANRARWTSKYEKGLVDVLLEFNVSHYRGQNGWTSEGWNRIVKDFNKLFPEARLSKAQIQDKEAQLKKDYKAIRSIRNRSGVSWNQNASMINTTSEKWDEIIEEDSRLRRYENKSFPLFESLDLLYEGQFAEGKHCFTSSQPSNIANTSITRKHSRDASITRKHSRDASFDSRVDERQDNMNSPPRMREREVERQELENDIQDEEENTMHSYQRMEDIARTVENVLQNRRAEQLDVEDNESNQQERGGDDHPNSRTGSAGAQRGRSKKQKGTSAPRIEETMAAYFEFRKEHASMKEQASKQGNEYSIARCFEVLQAMDDVSDEIKVFASDVFKDAINREIFLCYEPRLRGLWLKKEVNKLVN